MLKSMWLNFLLEKVENNMEKGENAGYQYFLLFPYYLQKALVFQYQT